MVDLDGDGVTDAIRSGTREAYRALKGQVLRTEIYARDGSAAESNPYSVVEHNYTVTCLQPSGPNRYASFYTHARETLSFHAVACT